MNSVYVVLKSFKLQELHCRVNKKISQGLTPVGGITQVKDTGMLMYLQSMVLDKAFIDSLNAGSLLAFSQSLRQEFAELKVYASYINSFPKDCVSIIDKSTNHPTLVISEEVNSLAQLHLLLSIAYIL